MGVQGQGTSAFQQRLRQPSHQQHRGPAAKGNLNISVFVFVCVCVCMSEGEGGVGGWHSEYLILEIVEYCVCV